MAIFRCKMCGGDLEIIENVSSCTCDFCGTKQTIPTIKDENIQGLFNRANVLRMKSEFDKAEEIYEKILQSSSTEAEAYWGLILCKYGIEYVEDPVTFKRVPTCHRASYESITADVDYKNALQYADVQQKLIYEAEAKEIEEVQKGIMALVANEKPYDVFICYKETDESGKRTQDSVIANDIYYQLTQEGFKVFYAAITLEDKLGTEYEPYIFSALNTAKVMLSLGTKPEYFNAVWVKNEWSRFLKIMKKDRSKMLIPCYRDMDAYELPEEFAHLQAQDMSKIGFINDIVRGIKKVVAKEDVAPQVVQQTIVQQSAPVNSNLQSLLKRGNMALEDREWQEADKFFEEVLNQDAECAEAYLGKLMAKCKRSSIDTLFYSYVIKYEEIESEELEKLEACEEATAHIEEMTSKYVVDEYLSYSEIKRQYTFDRTYVSKLSLRKQQKSQELTELATEKLLSRAKQYASGETKTLIDNMIAEVTTELDRRIEDAQKEDDEKRASIISSYEMHLNKTDAKIKELYSNAIDAKDDTYNYIKSQMNEAQTIFEYKKVRDLFKSMNGYKDTKILANKCQSEIDRLEEEGRQEARRAAEEKKRREEASAARKKKITIISIASIITIIVLFNVVSFAMELVKYKTAISEMQAGNYENAIQIFTELDSFKDSKRQISNCIVARKDEMYDSAVALMNSGNYKEAVEKFSMLNTYKDSKEKKVECDYNFAVSLMESREYETAIAVFENITDYNDSKEQIGKCKNAIMAESKVGDIVILGNYKHNTEWIVLDKVDKKVLVISKYAIEKRPISAGSVNWKDSTLRSWLNNKYLADTFSFDELSRILPTSITDTDNDDNNEEENNIVDKVFLLSINEVNKYFSTDIERKVTTSYGEKLFWWLRSSGTNRQYFAFVNINGKVDEYGGFCMRDTIGVRPAMWIDVSDS